jgi:hypothetical protein
MTAETFAPADLGTEDGPLLLDEPGRYDIPEADYHRDPLRHLGGSLSSTTARKLLPPSCPALARYAVEHPEHKDAYDLGSVTHRLTLGAGCEIVEVPAATWQTKAAKEAREDARARGAVALLSKDLAAAMAMRDAVHADPLAHALLTLPGGAPEQTLIWREGEEGTWCRAMFDRLGDPSVDLKTCDSVDDDHLQKAVWNYGYHVQRTFYGRGYRAVYGRDVDFFFIFVQKDPPHLVRVVQLDAELRRIGEQKVDEALDVWRTCQATGQWPAYPPIGDIALIGPPRWARTREEAW